MNPCLTLTDGTVLIASERDRKEIMPDEIAEFVEKLEDLYVEHKAGLLAEVEYVARKKVLIESLLDKEPQEPKEFFAALVKPIERGQLSPAEVSRISNNIAQNLS